MINHIDIIEQCIRNPESVSQQKLEDNYNAIKAIYNAAAYSRGVKDGGSDVDPAYIEYWVRRYHELNGGNHE